MARRMLQDGFTVRLLTRDPERARALFGPDFEYSVGNVGDAAAIERALQECQTPIRSTFTADFIVIGPMDSGVAPMVCLHWSCKYACTCHGRQCHCNTL